MAGHGKVSWLDVQFHCFGVCKVNKLDHIAGHGVDSNPYCEFALLTVATCEVWPLLGRKLKGPFNDVFEYIHHVLTIIFTSFLLFPLWGAHVHVAHVPVGSLNACLKFLYSTPDSCRSLIIIYTNYIHRFFYWIFMGTSRVHEGNHCL